MTSLLILFMDSTLKPANNSVQRKITKITTPKCGAGDHIMNDLGGLKN